MKKKAYNLTIIDIVALLTICALATLLLAPLTTNARQHSKQMICMTNLRNLSTAWVLYSQDNDGALVNGNVGSTASWVDRPQTEQGDITNHNSTIEEKINGIKAGLLFPYTNQPKMYHCPEDPRSTVKVGSRGIGAWRTYSIPTYAYYQQTNRPTVIQGLGSINFLRTYADISNPAAKYIFVEENYTHTPGNPVINPPDVGYNSGTWTFWRANQSQAWWDPIAAWHDEGMNLGYADGHAEHRRWMDERTIWFANDRYDPRLGTSSMECALQYNNPDQEYMTEAYPCRLIE